MPNTYTQLYVHYVFAVQNRRSLILKTFQEDLYKYLNGIVKQNCHKVYIINGTADHVHMLISMNPIQTPSELIYNLKRSSSLWINNNKLVLGKFSWQEGFGAFSVGKTQLEIVINYIKNQQEHHKRVLFIEEYVTFLKENDIEYDERYIFKSIE